MFKVFGEVWAFIHEYETMKARGYKLMTDENGEDYWVGYGD